MSASEVKAQLDSLFNSKYFGKTTYEYLTKQNGPFHFDYFQEDFFIKAAEKLKEVIISEIDNAGELTDKVKSALTKIIQKGKIIIDRGKEFGETDQEWKWAMVAVISFDSDDLYRASMFDTLNIYGGLYRGHTGEGVYNIMALFNNGAVNGGMSQYHLKTTIGSVDGDSEPVYNHAYYPPLHFLQRAIDRFNKDYTYLYYCVAELGDAYLA